jgi:hypothetical protein
MRSKKVLVLLFYYSFGTLSLSSKSKQYNITEIKAIYAIQAKVHHSATAVTPSRIFDVKTAEDSYQSWRASGNDDFTPRWRLCYPSKTLEASDFVPINLTTVYESISTIGLGSTYPACDGITRFRFSSGAALSTQVTFITKVHHASRLGNWTKSCTKQKTSSNAEPSCDVPEAFCSILWTSYQENLRTFSEAQPLETMTGRPAFPCNAPSECFLDLKIEVVLIYWPPRLVSRDICGADGMSRTIPGPATAASVATITAITFRGGNIYRRSWIKDGITSHWDDPKVEPSTMTGSWVLT